VVETDLDGDGGVDESDEGGRNSDEGGGSPVTGTNVSGDVGDETTSDDKEGLLSDKSRSVKEVDDLLEGLDEVDGRSVECTIAMYSSIERSDSRPCSC
jgi:hypothetical protein